MQFSEIPLRTNKDYITEEWFNTLRQAGIDSAGQLAVVTTVTSEIVAPNYMSSGYYLVDSTAGNLSVQLPVADQSIIITVKKISSDSNQVIIARFGTELLEGSTANYILLQQYESVTLINDGTDWYIV